MLPVTCAHPDTPTESMEFLARSWSVSAVELSKALCKTHPALNHHQLHLQHSLLSQNQPSETEESARGSDDTKELLLLHHPEFISHPHSLPNGIHKTIVKKKAMGRWMKDHKERKKQEIRAHNAQLHAAVSVAGVAAAVAASSIPSPQKSKNKKPSANANAIASAAALVASYCIEIAEDLGADHDHILAVVHSAINARTNGDVMTLTAGAATALRGSATMRARLHREHGPALADENVWNGKESSVSTSLNFVYKGGELLKRTRKGDLHWKRVSFNINSNWQVVAKLKSKHIGGTFTKKKKCVVSGVYSDIRAWPGRESEGGAEQMAYFAVQTADRVIEFECKNKEEMRMWVEGLQNMMHLHAV